MVFSELEHHAHTDVDPAGLPWAPWASLPTFPSLAGPEFDVLSERIQRNWLKYIKTPVTSISIVGYFGAGSLQRSLGRAVPDPSWPQGFPFPAIPAGD